MYALGIKREPGLRGQCCDDATGWTVLALIPGRGNMFFLFSKTPRPALGPTVSPVQWASAFFSGGKAVGA